MKINREAARPFDVKQVLEGIAETWGVSADDVETQVDSNFEELCALLEAANEKPAK